MPIDGDRAALTRGGLGFYLGLATTFVPLGMGASFASFLFLDTRDTTVTIAGALTIGIGVLELAGGPKPSACLRRSEDTYSVLPGRILGSVDGR